MRYEVRWANGFWVLFDGMAYAIADTFGLREHADEAVASANADGRWRLANHAGYVHPWKLSKASL